MSRKRKIDSECRIFNERWSEAYFFTNIDEKAICLICKEKVSVFKEYNLKRHYDTKHSTNYDMYKNILRKEKYEQLLKDLKKQQNTLNKFKQLNLNAIKASYQVAYLIASESKSFQDAEFVKKCLLNITEIMCPEKRPLMEDISLSRQTITRRVENIAKDLLDQLSSRLSAIKYFSIALNESNDVKDTAQLMIFVRSVDENFHVIEEFADLQSLHGRTTAEELLKSFNSFVEKLRLNLKFLIGVTTDGARNMTGKNIGLVSRISKQISEIGGDPLIGIHCIIHQEVLCGKIIVMENVMTVVVRTVNFIRANGLNHRMFQEFLSEIESEYGDLILHSAVRWLSRGKILQRFFKLRAEIDIFMNEKGTPLKELSNKEWLNDLAFLVDITNHLNALNLKLQGKGKLICHLTSNIKAFQQKLFLFKNQIENYQLDHFPSLTELKENFSTNRYSNAVQQLIEEFGIRFAELKTYDKQIMLFEDPFSAIPANYSAALQLEIIDLQSQTVLRNKYLSCEDNLLEFYKALSNEFPFIKDNAMKLATLFGSTYICEQAFSRMKIIKSIKRNRITDDHLNAVLRIGISEIQPNFEKLAKEMQPQASH